MAQEQQVGSVFADMEKIPPAIHAMLLGALEAMAAHPEIRRVRAIAYDELRPAPGVRLLDAGCGVGEVARGLAAAVGPTGEVVALDLSATTVAAAAARHDGSAVRYVQGNVAALDFPDATFDGIRTERVLQHVADPDAVIAELIRVTRPGGRVCLVDTDWDSLAVDGVDVELVAAVRAHAYSHSLKHHRSMGRTLRGRLVRGGLTDISVIPVTCMFDDPESAAVVVPIINPGLPADAGMVPHELSEPWFTAIAESGSRGDFLAVLTIWVVTGTKN